jgi:hypothetical protein
MVGSKPEKIRKYADEAFVPVHWVERDLEAQKPLPRHLVGFPIEVNNGVWGVLVIDSKNAPIEKATVEGLHPHYAVIIGKILEGTALHV